ncbi:MAG: hypothetical protein WC536_04995 [Patescibacteria group bacterium]
MDKDLNELPSNISIVGKQEQAVLEAVTDGSWKKYARVAMAALGGVPWVGSVLSATATLSSENEQGKTNQVIFLWAKEHEQKLKELSVVLGDIFERFNSFGEEINQRLESTEYLSLVRTTFRKWDQAETYEKRGMLKKLITNSGVITLAQDDLVRLFLEWTEKYHEFHFIVIREIYKNPSITRGAIWENIRGETPREDSAEADLFKLLIRDLSTGGVIRQERETDYDGRFVKKRKSQNGSGRSSTLESAFEDTKPYVLTGLGAQFVHYVMEDIAPQITGNK